jgi:4-amino-4-deoxy-L-arabinose transferase-like glycosyltransferase
MHYQSNRLESRLSAEWIDDAATPEPSAPRRTDTAAKLALIFLVVAASVARIALLDTPFTRNHESTASGPMVCAARNLVRYGMWSQKFCGVLNTGHVSQEQWVWYAHHPPLVVMTIAWSSALFGTSEWCYRFPSAIFSVLGTAMIFVMINRRFGWRTALTAGAIHSFIPFAWLFAGMPDVVGPHMVFFGLATIECYSRWFQTRRPHWMWLMAGAFTLCALSDWSAYFLPPVLATHYLLSHRWRQWHRAALRIAPYAIGAALLLAALGAML